MMKGIRMVIPRRGYCGEGTFVQTSKPLERRGTERKSPHAQQNRRVRDQLILDGLRVALLGLFFSLEITLSLLAGSTFLVFACSLQTRFLCFVFLFVSQLGLL